MNVQAILDRVFAISLNEDSPDSALQTRALRYLNDTYKEVLREVNQLRVNDLTLDETLTVSGGQIVLSHTPLEVKSVTNITDEQTMYRSDLASILRKDPDLSDTGSPVFYYFDSTGAATMKVWPPEEGVSIRVLYNPKVDDLEITDAESDILLPPEYHDVLVWGTLRWNFLDERDARTVQELGYSQAQFEITKNDLKRYIMRQQERIKSIGEDF
jgi:hypothetical protein